MQGSDDNEERAVTLIDRSLAHPIAETLFARAIDKLDEALGYHSLWFAYGQIFYLSNALDALQQARQHMRALAAGMRDNDAWHHWNAEVETALADVVDDVKWALDTHQQKSYNTSG